MRRGFCTIVLHLFSEVVYTLLYMYVHVAHILIKGGVLILGVIVTIVVLMQVELLCDENLLHKDSTLKFIWISHWLKRDPPMVLNYRLKQRLG